ncbi:hypothetical protein [Mycobacterium sp. 3519A]|uniref:hypothetical protein n=1 Tax=Mycobacterium sp. 3519A TaxID=2057184 RepID=UPI000C7AD852|nr:hypothetical protein [Mycobacterium sp. 3519A]
MRRMTIAAAVVSAAVATAPVAPADPSAPLDGTPCASDLADVMTWPADAQMPLLCTDGRWQTVTSPPPPNDRWLSFGPTMTLHGQGLRNPSVTSGDWTATPLDANGRCRAEQRAVVEAGVVGPPQTAESEPGQPLSFHMLPQLYSIEMSGHCLWTLVRE